MPDHEYSPCEEMRSTPTNLESEVKAEVEVNRSSSSGSLKAKLKAVLSGRKSRTNMKSMSETNLETVLIIQPVTVMIDEQPRSLDVAHAGLFTFHKSSRKGMLTRKKLNVNYIKDIDFTTYFLDFDNYYCFWSNSRSLSFYIIPTFTAQQHLSDEQLTNAIVDVELVKMRYLAAEYNHILGMVGGSSSSHTSTGQPLASYVLPL